ncbi:hypothetical protein QBC39DRAFT_155881 [Podospora conica]|nr:hypothetical protein QBC39DRAFT_155881 [Schizothecium conicum]
MTAVVAAIGATVGYLGAEVAEESMFERILWPQRYHNYLDFASLAKLSLLMPMSGPLHRAALVTLDGFRDHGLYRGFLRGDMLGTAFFSRQKGAKYHDRTRTTPVPTPSPQHLATPSGDVRNGFWIEVLRQVERRRPLKRTGAARDGGDDGGNDKAPMRAAKPIFRLSLDIHPLDAPRNGPGIKVCESRLTVWTFVGIFLSELSTLCIALATGLWYRLGDASTTKLPDAWLVGFLCIPLLLKILAALFSVRREGIAGQGTPLDLSAPAQISTASSSSTSTSLQDAPKPLSRSVPKCREPPARARGTGPKVILEITDPTIGFALVISTPPVTSALFQFFRHYGHPARASYMDRVRETASILVVYAFLFYFPVGLFALSWMSEPSQYIWLGQQLYCVGAMHIVRLAGWQTCSRTEERVAKLLLQNKTVYLVGDGGGWAEARLEVEEVGSVREGKGRVLEILRWNEELGRARSG